MLPVYHAYGRQGLWSKYDDGPRLTQDTRLTLAVFLAGCGRSTSDNDGVSGSDGPPVRCETTVIRSAVRSGTTTSTRSYLNSPKGGRRV